MTIAIKPVALSTLGTIEIICSELLDTAQAWSDRTFDNQYRAAVLTLIEGLALLVGYVVGYAYSWLRLQCMTAVRYGLSEAVQSVPVSEGWWSAPFVVFEPTPYPAYCWQALSQSVNAGILAYELSFAVGAAEDRFVLQ